MDKSDLKSTNSDPDAWLNNSHSIHGAGFRTTCDEDCLLYDEIFTDCDSKKSETSQMGGQKFVQKTSQHTLVPSSSFPMTSFPAVAETPNQVVDCEERVVYARNMHRLIVTARHELQKRDQEICRLKTRLAHGRTVLAVQCPTCAHQFSVPSKLVPFSVQAAVGTTEKPMSPPSPRRFLPRYIRPLRATNRLELHFDGPDQLDNWLVAYDLDTDQNGVPVLPPAGAGSSSTGRFSTSTAEPSTPNNSKKNGV